jgi:hypothetical protein
MAAQRYASLVLQKPSTPVCEKTLPDEHVPATDYHTVDVNRLDAKVLAPKHCVCML